ncbi:hypothetical protein [Nocardia salmonicida]|uniref:hypothetical protein n=1 Tax=Nocardia salmonicida TaxID=53431 RepID=UPI00362C53A9
MSTPYVGRHRLATPDLRTTVLCAIVGLLLLASPALLGMTIALGVLAERGAL